MKCCLDWLCQIRDLSGLPPVSLFETFMGLQVWKTRVVIWQFLFEFVWRPGCLIEWSWIKPLRKSYILPLLWLCHWIMFPKGSRKNIHHDFAHLNSSPAQCCTNSLRYNSFSLFYDLGKWKCVHWGDPVRQALTKYIYKMFYRVFDTEP